MVWPELVRQSRPFRPPPEQIGEPFHLHAAIGEDEVRAAAQGLVEMSRYFQVVAGEHLLEFNRGACPFCGEQLRSRSSAAG